MWTRKRLVTAGWLFILCGQTLLLSSEARSVETPRTPEESVDYLEDYTGVDEDTIGVGRKGKLVLEEIFGSGLKDEEEIYKEEGIKSRKDNNETETRSESRSLGDPPSPVNADVQGTIEQVEKILAANPELPRLSHEQILEIYNNITESEKRNEDSQPEETVTTSTDANDTNQTGRETNKKSLLVVLPFNANDMKDENIEELFTKKPVTQMVGAEFEMPVKISPNKPTSESEFSHEDSSNTVLQSPVYKPNEALHTAGSQIMRPTTNLYRQILKSNRTRPVYSSTTRASHTSTSRPHYSSSTRQTYNPTATYLTPPPRTTHTSTVKPYSSVTRSTYRTTSKPYTTPVRTTYRTTMRPTRVPNKQLAGQTNPPTSNSNVQNYQTTNFQSYKENVIHTNRETTTTQRPTLIQYEIHKRKKPQPSESAEQGYKTIPKVESRPDITQYQDINPFKPILPPKHGVTKSPSDADNYLSQQSSNVNAFRPLPNVKPKKPPQATVVTNNGEGFPGKPGVRPDIQSVLASLGLYPDETTQSAPTTTVTTSKPTIEMQVGAEALTPDMKEVLESLGLLPAASNIQPVVHQDSATTEPAEVLIPSPVSSNIDVASYSNFKPLPSGSASSIGDKDVNGELKQILENFGLVPGSALGESTLNFDTLGQIDVSGNRKQKAMSPAETENKIKSEKAENKDKKNKVPEVNMDVLSDDMKNVLIDLGLVTTTIRSTTSTDSDKEGHIFNPVEQAATFNETETQFEKLNQLINTIQLLAKDNNTFTKEELEELHAAFNLQPVMETESENNKSDIATILTDNKHGLSLDHILDGPDPLASEELVNLYVKNEVKRQQPKNGTDTITAADDEAFSSMYDDAISTSTTTESSSESSTTEGAEISTGDSTDERVPALTNFSESETEDGAIGDGGASIADLEDSFGGESEDVKQKRPNGLYFLLDWNSFLEVGEDGKNKTVIRFMPKVGNPKNFISVTVP